jgi:superfamily II DNA helicase RecQ
MLPAFCVQGGTSIVVVPLQSLQTDLKGRCDKDGITCVIWRAGQAIEPTSVVLVTPESALTQGFRDFINLLRATHRSERVFIDECHSVLASSATFRPTMRHLGELVRVGAQMVFLTATLRPRSEEQFCQSMNIIGRGVVKIREPTTRKNIKYQIRTYQSVRQKGSKDDGMIAAVVRVVEELKIKYPAPAKIIVYSRVITQAEELSEALGCMLYHATVDGRDGKDKRLRKWQSGEEESRVAVATNAMGLGINTGDTRGVVHAGMPEDLADYAQESGRGGRDELGSEAIVVLPVGEEAAAKIRRGVNSRVIRRGRPGPAVIYHHKKDRPPTQEENEKAAEVEEFVHGRCRRVALEQSMDGNFERSGCMPDEEACDLCDGRQQEAHDESSAALDDDQQCQPEWSRQDDIPQQGAQDEMRFSQQDQERCWIDFHVRERERQEAYEVEELERQLDRFNNQCIYCYIHGIPSTMHSIDRCTTQGVQVIQQGVKEFIQNVQEKKSFERFSCCLYCYVPQAICQRWKHKEEDGRWEEDSSEDCQYKNVIIPAFWSMVTFGGEQEMEWLCQWAEEDGYNIRDPDQEAWWFGKKVEWGGIEGNNLSKAFGIIAQRVNEAMAKRKQLPRLHIAEQSSDEMLDSGIGMASSPTPPHIANSGPPMVM